MEILDLDERRVTEPVCLMIGNFDGVHLGHQAIIAKAKTFAQAHGLKTAVLSFDPHPLKVLAPEKAPRLLQTPFQKRALLAYHGVDFYVVQHFDKALSLLSPEAFIERLKARVAFRFIFVGFNFHFGHRREGTPETLIALADKYGFSVEMVDAYIKDGSPISSSRIRKLLLEGSVDQAHALLGRPYFLEGQVVHGDQVGGKIQTPTANIDVTNELLPKFGVYSSWARVDNHWFRAITNIGIAPTLHRTEPRVETHLFDFDASLYDHHLVVCLGRFMRPEIRFDSLSALKSRIGEDIRQRLAFEDRTPPVFPIL